MWKLRLRKVKKIVTGHAVGQRSSGNATHGYLTGDPVYLISPHCVASRASPFPPTGRAAFLQASYGGEALGPACARHTVHPAGEAACSQLRDGGH